MFTLRHELETLFIIILLSSVSIFFIFKNNYKNQSHIITPIPDVLKLNSSSIQSVSPTPTIQTTSWTSSDGTKQITMETQNNNGEKNYSFFVTPTSEDSQKKQPFFSKTVDADTSFLIPFNTFSTNNKYLFLQRKDKNQTDFLVFDVSGQLITKENQYIDISSLFKKYTSVYTLHQVTGWASNTLLIIESSKNDNSPGPSFWFDVTNQSFIQLSTRF